MLTDDEVAKMELNDVLIGFTEGKVSALQLVKAQPDKIWMYNSFIRANNTTECEVSAMAFWDYLNEMAKIVD